MSSAHTYIATFKPHSFGHHFELYADGIYYCDPKASANAATSVGPHNGQGRGYNKKILTGVTCTLGTNSVTIEIKKSDASWTFGVVKVGPSHRAKATAFKSAVDAAVTAYVP